MSKIFVIFDNIVCEFKKIHHSKHLRITIHQNKRILVTAPYYASYKAMNLFLISKKGWIKKKLYKFDKQKSLVTVSGNNNYKKYKEQSRLFVLGRLEYFNQFYRFKYNRVSIRNQKTRWGSCSIKGNLNFNYKLLFLSQEQADYIVVHELCHLKEMNHSKRFWDLVSKTIPNYKELRKILKKQII